MRPFKRILVPVDFSPHSDEAIMTAVDLAKRYEASITLLHVFEPMTYALPEGYEIYTPAQLTRMMAEFDKQLVTARQRAEAAGAMRVDTKQLHGPAAPEIVDFARAGDYDLIVMGTHGRTGIKHALLGSVAERVLRRAPCPVLATHTRPL